MNNNLETFWIKTSVSSDAPIRLYPSWGYSEFENINPVFHRTQGGSLNRYQLVTSWSNFTVPVQVTSEDGNIIRGWWNSNTQVSFIRMTDITSLTNTCRIANQTEPFPQNMDKQFSRFEGTLNLVTVS